VPGDDEGIVGVIDPLELHGWIFIQEVVALPVCHAEGGYGLARIVDFSVVGHHPIFHEADYAVAEKLGMDAQVLLALQIGDHCIGNQSVAHLNGRAVLNQAGHISAYLLDDIRRGFEGVLQQWLVMRNHEVYVLDVDESVTVGARHIAVDLDHHQACLLHGALDHVHADSQAEVAVLVRQGGLDQGHIHPDQLGAE